MRERDGGNVEVQSRATTNDGEKKKLAGNGRECSTSGERHY